MVAILHMPKNKLPRIDELWAFLSVDADGEGVIAAPYLGPGWGPVPLIAADPERLKTITPIAEGIARTTGRKVRLVKFTTRKLVREIPGK
jgi:hypothetical protein